VRVVISQSMLFPWVGMLEQVRLADAFVHYDDVQFSKGSFVNRVQVKTPEGLKWMSVPLQDLHLGQRIDAVKPAPAILWREQHLSLLHRSFAQAPHAADALALAERVYGMEHPNLASLARSSLLAVVAYFELDTGTAFHDAATLGIGGSSSERVLGIIQRLNGQTYITGHGAARYLDHEGFERAGVQVQYMDYQTRPYPQSYGAFTPYVSSLDLVAHCGRQGVERIASGSMGWRDFLQRRSAS